jgi:hypothetical protein
MNLSDKELNDLTDALEAQIDAKEHTYKAVDRLCIPRLQSLYFKLEKVKHYRRKYEDQCS